MNFRTLKRNKIKWEEKKKDSDFSENDEILAHRGPFSLSALKYQK